MTRLGSMAMLAWAVTLAGCGQNEVVPQAPAAAGPPEEAPQPGPDPHSFANLDAFRARHADLFLEADFGRRILTGSVQLRVERLDPAAQEVVLDTRDLAIESVGLNISGTKLAGLAWRLGDADPVLGQPLVISLPAGLRQNEFTLVIHYRSSPRASGLQWLEPRQTAGGQHPFLFSQSQAIHARSWIPLQDSPRVRMTFTAKIQAPAPLNVVMSAINPDGPAPDGTYRFEMPQPIPSYLFAIAVGELEFRAMGERTGVYAEPSVVAAAAAEFADTEAMLEISEALYGPYRWGRYDLLILPPSFPFGGMENPRVSFITPTVIAGDRSLVSIIAHELAHSWSGNLVTNASWGDLWLNEGFTSYFDSRIMEAVYGIDRRNMEDVLGYEELLEDLARLPPEEQRLAQDLRGRDPDAVFSSVPYQKGKLFLDFLEARFGRERFDAFLSGYFDRFAFESIGSEQFVTYLSRHLLEKSPELVSEDEVRAWVYGSGLPAGAVLPQSDAFVQVAAQRRRWLTGEIGASELPTQTWTVHEWRYFLDTLPDDVGAARLAELDEAYALTGTGNAEIGLAWYRAAIINGYVAAYPALAAYLETIGRRRLIRPLYEQLMKTDDGAVFAREVYARARPGYHPIAVATLDPIVLGGDK